MRLQEKYNKTVAPALKEKYGYQNVFQIPKMKKAVINVGFGRQAKEKALIDSIENNLSRITGQKPKLAKAKKSISAFKLREGTVIGAASTLRGKRMYDFVDKLINASFPRIRDFRGLGRKIVDNKGNITIGIKEHICFPEIGVDEVDNIHGLEISIATTAQNHEEGLELFRLLGFPFKEAEEGKK